MRLPLPLLAVLLVSACQVDPAPSDNAQNAATTPTVVPSEGGNAVSNDSAPPAPAPAPVPTAPSAPPAPAPSSPPIPADPNAIPASEKTPAAAKRLLDSYFAALATKDYRSAYRMWNGNGEATGMTESAFAASFAKYRIYDGRAFGPGDSEGAAGSIYIEFPVTVTGILARGGGFHLSGSITVKRVNDVDGSTSYQRHWHIQSSDLKPRP